MKANEGLYNFINKILLSLEFLLVYLERWRENYKKNNWFKKRIDAAH